MYRSLRYKNLPRTAALSAGVRIALSAFVLLTATACEAQTSTGGSAGLPRHRYATTIFSLYGDLIMLALVLFVIIVMMFLLLHVRAESMRRQRMENEQLQDKMRHDELTGVFNRQGFFEEAGEMIKASNGDLLIVRINVSHFKLINEIYGVEKGDSLLREMGSDLKELGRKYKFIVGRFTADHFYLCIQKDVFEEISFPPKSPAPWLGMDVSLTYGVYPVGSGGDMAVGAMCDRADMANSSAGQGAGHLRYYSDETRQRMLREQEIENEMEKALSQRQFCIYIQPKYDVDTGRIIGGEALVRWLHPEKGLIPPGEFIGLFEKNGFIQELDFYVWEQCCRFIAASRERGLPAIPISVNVSRIHFYDQRFVQRLIELTERCGVSPWELQLEITETVCSDDPDMIFSRCSELREAGFRIAMDDFGSGYSSLNMLKEMPLDILKMDLRFLSGGSGEEQARKGKDILRTAIELANNLKLEAVVEGVETKEQVDFIKSVGGCGAQGYYFARPLPEADFAALLEKAADLEVPSDHGAESAVRVSPRLLFGSRRAAIIDMVLGGSDMYAYLLPEKKGILTEKAAAAYRLPTVVDDLCLTMVEKGFIGPGSIDAWKNVFAAADRMENDVSDIITLCDNDGGYRQYWLRLDTVLAGDGTAIAIMTLDDFTDISQQNRAKNNDISALLQVTHWVFPEMVTYNLTAGSYRVLRHEGVTATSFPSQGRIDDMVADLAGKIYEEDREEVVRQFSLDGLKEAFIERGEESVQIAYRRPGRDGRTGWVESTIVRQRRHEGDDILLVGVSRYIDSQKAEEIKLREQLKLQAEELRITMSMISKTVSYYDVRTSVLTMPEARARENGIPSVMEGFPESFLAASRDRLSAEAAETIQRFYSDIRSGKPSGVCDYRIGGSQDEEMWMHLESATIFDDDGLPARAVVTVENVTVQRTQSIENRRLKENERILRLITQHSDRIICYYDVQHETARVWDENTCAKCRLPHLCEMTASSVLKSGGILPESVDDLRNAFKSIKEGVPYGAIKMRAVTPDGEKRWYDLQYSTICDDDGKAVSALISHKDITEEYEHELAYRRYLQTIEAGDEKDVLFLESDLTADRVDKLEGNMLTFPKQIEEYTHSDFVRLMIGDKFRYEDAEEAQLRFSRENLLELYADGQRRIKSEWKVRFEDGTPHWIGIEAVLLSDHYNGHIKAFFRVTDVTERKERQLAIQHRSERDGMTGLLNRITAEERINKAIAQQPPGMLLAIDLDDLKGINDTFGHSEGDRAIIGVADTVRAYFGDNSIIGRIGGDEFIVYLPATDDSDAVAVSLTALLRRLTGIQIGPNGERRLNCSVGYAAVTEEAASFNTLYRMADKALYHIKRSGKSSFAFYSPDMDDEDYLFMEQKLFGLRSDKKFESGELHDLLGAIASYYQLVLSVNVSENHYYLVEEVKDGVFSKLPTFGVLDDFVKATAKGIHPEDVQSFIDCLSREALHRCYEEGRKNVSHSFRFTDGKRWRMVEATAIFRTAENGDICDFTLVRWLD